MKKYGKFKGKDAVVIDAFDPSSISDAIAKLVAKSKNINADLVTVMESIGQTGEELAKSKAPRDTGDLQDSITHETTVEGNKITTTITAGSDHAMFTEFGTGIVGDAFNHPMADEVGWKYDVNEHGGTGWSYMGKDGEYHRTLGQSAKRYMYDTAKDLELHASEIIEKAIK